MKGDELMNTKKLTVLSISVALAMILSFVESQIPPFVAIPGIKIGLANIVTVFLLYKLGWKEAAAVSVVRVALSSLLFGSAASFFYSASGAVLSFAVMVIIKMLPLFSEISVSIVGGVFHNVGQIICACIIMENGGIVTYLPPLLISGTVAGIAVGALSALLLKKLEKII